jgi:ribokinase
MNIMERTPKILVVGSFVMDTIATTERIPQAGQTVYGKAFHMAPGGKGANQALQCARLGADVTMMGCVGDDLFGTQLVEVLKQANANVEHVVVRENTTSGVGHVTLEVAEHTAQNRIIVISGANNTLTVQDVAWVRDEISSYDMVLLQLEIPLEVNRAVAHWAHDAGVPVMLNPAPATELDDELLSLVTFLIPNEQEASSETNLPLRMDERGIQREDLKQIAAALWARGVENVIITLGGNGSAVIKCNGISYVPCVQMPHVADPTAAGDSFVGALAVGLTMGLSQEESLTFASFAAAITVSRIGAMPSLPTLDEVRALLQERDCHAFDTAILDRLQA